ncbi:flagellar hook-length control protein FliK [Paenibacillus xerothermodurans]|uniref:Flagellar hook-length control protein FliK n=1 Tax=Paenibacillus xerothermodurans TaxID=1977292 RepID=A0A2W1NH44_PAEXE|nr:flagellar hook-length control protein FliK [Paenibacillus xerothermodurans]PZE22451.1 flagellar hook-length control protein FliK [Paenibacillus xerothermodurans]
MVVQSQAPINAAAFTSTSVAGNTIASASAEVNGQAVGGFSAALNGVLAGMPTDSQPSVQLSLTGLAALNQLLLAFERTASVSPDTQAEAALQQLDALVELLDADSEDASALLHNPDVQAWLVQMQAALMAYSSFTEPAVAPDGNSSGDAVTGDRAVELPLANHNVKAVGVNSLLFVPMEQPLEADDSLPGQAVSTLSNFSKSEAIDLLQQVKEVLQQTTKSQVAVTESARTIHAKVAELQEVLAPLLAGRRQDEVNKSGTANGSYTLAGGSALSHSRPNAQQNLLKPDTSVSIEVQAQPVSVNPKLEILAAKSAPPQTVTSSSLVTVDAPLFEPLVEMPTEMTEDNQAMPIHEFLKKLDNGERINKTLILVMNAPAFVEEMAEFVIKSFTMDVRAEGITEAKLSLYPEHLGQVDVKLTMQNGQLVAQFVAESAVGREMLESQLSQLKTTLQSQGIQVDKLEVSQSQAFESGLFQEQRQQQFKQSNKQQKDASSGEIVALDDELAQPKDKPAQSSRASRHTSIDTIA